jgi:nicotinamide-nucleotide amidase
MLSPEIDEMARQVLDRARAAGLKLATAESCTGGLIAGALCAVAGASDVFDRGFVTYSNAAKMQMLGVAPEILDSFGAVSEPTARAMALGAIGNSQADLAVITTGVAGPGGGSPEKPVGTVHIAVARRDGAVTSRREQFNQHLSRRDIQLASVLSGLGLLFDTLEATPS